MKKSKMRDAVPQPRPPVSFRPGLACAVLTVAAVAATPPLRGHTPITTRYGYDADVRPVLERHCARCHSPGGPTPMSLRSYEDARPWAESIREQLLARSMPPLFVEHGSVDVRNGSPLTARELDILVDWATGGAPERASRARSTASTATATTSEGPREAARPEPSVRPEPSREWQSREWSDFVSPEDQDGPELRVAHRLGVGETRHLTAWRLEGDPWLRGAVLWIEAADAGGGDRVIGTDVFLGGWIAGDEPFFFPAGAAFELRRGSTIRVDARYKRTWLLRSRKLNPRTRLGLLYAPRQASRNVISVAVSGGEREAERLGTGAAALAFFPPASGAGTLVLERGGGSRVLLGLYRVAEDWPVMYRFVRPETGRLAWRPRDPAAVGAPGYALFVTSR